MAEYHVENFGCRASQADGAAISIALEKHGLLPAPTVASADVLILNTCSVTEEADRQARAFLRKARRAHPGIRVLVTGCYAQRAPDEVAALPGVDRVVGNSHKALVADTAALMAGVSAVGGQAESGTGTLSIIPLHTLLENGLPLVDDSFAHAEMALLSPAGTQSNPWQLTRPNLKVQDGCGNRCSFCVIPQTRGNSRSVTPEKILGGVRAFVEGGGQEMVLSGINLGRWGRDLKIGDAMPRRLEELVDTILRGTALPRLRISSVEPMDWSQQLLELFRRFSSGIHPRLARHAHLPLQSGSDAILRAMYRRYRPWHYEEKVLAIREALPEAAIGADVMVGFPGETESHFKQTFDFIEKLPFTYLHLFPFSARPGTPAWSLHREKPVHGQAVIERMAALRAMSHAKHRSFREQFVGKAVSAISLKSGEVRPGGTRAITDNFMTVEIDEQLPANRMLEVTIGSLTLNGLRAQVALRQA